MISSSAAAARTSSSNSLQHNGLNQDGSPEPKFEPVNPVVGPLLTDMYQLTMAYAYWHSKRQDDDAVFDLFFRKNPFHGEFTVFMGLEEVLRYVHSFKFAKHDIAYLRELMHWAKPAFFEWLETLDCKKVRIYALKEGSVCFPRVPLMRVEGPLAVCQLLETTLLNLVNYPSLVATNAARMRNAAGKNKQMVEFGLRRAQGPDGALSASRYTYAGGFDGTSDVLAAKLFGVPCKGTHAHAFVNTFSGFEDLKDRSLKAPEGSGRPDIPDFVAMVLAAREELGFQRTHDGELAAFVAFAQSAPTVFLALVDTYDTLKSGIPNFLTVATVLRRVGYTPLGVRLDSGDLAYLSKSARALFTQAAKQTGFEEFARLQIVASNDINEQTILSLNQQGHEIDSFGVGTHLVTCQSQPALGCVYKLVSVKGKSCIKLSEDISKVTIPGRKEAHRLVGKSGDPLVDLLIPVGGRAPCPGERIMCRHPFDEVKRAYVTPTRVEPLHHLFWDGKVVRDLPNIDEIRRYVQEQLSSLREDMLRPLNPTPYKVSVSEELYDFSHKLWLENAPVHELS
eukprot:tig00000093_g3474.t1